MTHSYCLTRVPDGELILNLTALVTRDRATTAEMLAHIAEVDARRLYRAMGHPSMRQYCVNELRFSEDAASKRIRAARKAREFPVLLEALADGRLHLGAVSLLGAHLTAENVDDLVKLATHRTKSEIELLLARTFPTSGVFTWVDPLGRQTSEQAPGPVEGFPACPGEDRMVEQPAPGRAVETSPSMVKPLDIERFALQATINGHAYALLQEAQALLAHRVPGGDVGEVIERALEALVEKLRKRKFAATDRPRQTRGPRNSSNPRHIPADVKRAVWERDGGQCTFTTDDGRRCTARSGELEFDHVVEVARGGESTLENLRLRCRAHNLYAAERTYGAAFMAGKREQARLAGAEARAQKAAIEDDPERSVVPWLRQLGFRIEDARRAAARCDHLEDLTIVERVRAALSYVRPGAASHGFVQETGPGYGSSRLPPPARRARRCQGVRRWPKWMVAPSRRTRRRERSHRFEVTGSRPGISRASYARSDRGRDDARVRARRASGGRPTRTT